MELSPEEKNRIYEEEKARIEAREKIEREKLTAGAGEVQVQGYRQILLDYCAMLPDG